MASFRNKTIAAQNVSEAVKPATQTRSTMALLFWERRSGDRNVGVAAAYLRPFKLLLDMHSTIYALGGAFD